MRRLPKIALSTLVACLIALLIAWAAIAAYSRHAAANDRIASLEAKVQELKGAAHPRWGVREGRFSISTTDRPENAHWKDFRLPYGTNEVQKFEEYIWKEPGRIVTAWVSDWTPRSEMSKFEQFTVASSNINSKFEVVAKPRTNESIAMEFTVTFIVE